MDEETQWDEKMKLWIYYFHRWEERMCQCHQSAPLKEKAPINSRLSMPKKKQHWKKHSRNYPRIPETVALKEKNNSNCDKLWYTSDSDQPPLLNPKDEVK